MLPAAHRNTPSPTTAPCTEAEMRVVYVAYLAVIGIGLLYTFVLALRHS